MPHDPSLVDSGVHRGIDEGPGTRADMHCHSWASKGAAVAALKWIQCPECYSPPEKVYDQAKARGMDLVTLTDHDTIDGAMELVERGFEGVIVGEEVTVYFPEDGCKLHVLVWGITPQQHEELGRLGLRADVYAFARWLRERGLAHALAHPLYVQNKLLTKWHLDRCALLFKGFEVLNGAHAPSHRAGLEAYLAGLTPGRVLRLIEETGIEPLWARCWEKALTGGSDDHGLLNVGRTWTRVGGARLTDGREFLRRVMAGQSSGEGEAGHSALLAHQLTTVAAHYAARRLVPRASALGREAARRTLRFAGVAVPRPGTIALAASVLRSKVRGALPGRRGPADRFKPLIDAARVSLGPLLEKHQGVASRLNPSQWTGGSALSDHAAMAAFADDLHAAVHGILTASAGSAWRSRDARRIMDHVLSFAALELSQLPTLFSLFHQNKERLFVEQLRHESGASAPGERPMRVLLFTDTLGDVNGVSRFIRNAAAQARASGRDLRVITSTNFEVPAEPNILNFRPLFATKMPKYENLEIAIPPLVRILREVDALQPDAIHISTPGPVGTVGYIAARMLRAPMLGVYHTDFPAYVRHLFEDEGATWLASRWMSLFYGPFARVFTRSAEYAGSLEGLGIKPERIERLRPGIVTETFQPRFRDVNGLAAMGCRPGSTVRVLYAGRVSLEKNLPLLTKVWKAADRDLRARGIEAELVIVGDGPYKAEMERALAGTRATFLGFRHGAELSTIYASCDLFAFPSVTDTLGQVVMEAQSSGLPVIVTDKGGPREVVREGVTGLVVSDDDVRGWIEAIVGLGADPTRRQAMGRAAHESIQGLTMAASFEHFWSVHEAAWREHLSRHGVGTRSTPAPEPVGVR